jgi:hypothetical protein
MTSKERVLTSINHKEIGIIPSDIGGSTVTGMHVLAVEKLREYYGLKCKPIRVHEPMQMLGEVDDELKTILGVDVEGIFPPKNKFGMSHDSGWKEFRTLWGQTVLLPQEFNTTIGEEGSHLVYPQGDITVAPSAKMPSSGYYFDAIIRQEAINDNALNADENLEEFNLISEEDVGYWKNQFNRLRKSERAIIAGFGGTALGDISTVPGLSLKNPKGIRDISEWYMSFELRRDYLHQIFERQTDIALHNLKRIIDSGGEAVDVIYICGTDFGTQVSTFCSGETFEELFAPYYRKLNNWIHKNTRWKTFKHSCGAIEPFISRFIECGFDILNPVQINASGMEPGHLKNKYGQNIVFWGGGVDTQKVLAFGTPAEVKKQVIENCKIFGKGGGFIFSAVHNIQANVPVVNIVAMVDALKEYNR